MLGEGFYTFRVRATGKAELGTGEDHFDVRIWEDTDTEDASLYKAKNTIEGGNIVVHKK